MPVGRFAPSPTGDLHLGNLRTALVAWLDARSGGSRFLLRMEDLDRATSSRRWEGRQAAQLASLGLVHDGEVVRQSSRFALYHRAIGELEARSLTYECFCTRREIRESTRAPHNDAGGDAYPGTCRDLDGESRRAALRSGRRPAIRFRADGRSHSFSDVLTGPRSGTATDVVLRRNDGVPAYNLAVVVDDAAQGVERVVRGDDLLSITPSQVHLSEVLGLPAVSYLHVPLVLGTGGARLAKRTGDVTLGGLVRDGRSPREVRSVLAVSLELASPGEQPTIAELVERYDPASIPRHPWTPA